jgi:4-alpha-glucanotransferase
VVYTGTHDNDTTLGWYKNLGAPEKKFLSDYLGGDISDKTVAERMIKTAFSTAAELAVIPMQDILGLDSSARMNTPGTADGNWRWRMEPGTFNGDTAARLKETAEIYGRLNS